MGEVFITYVLPAISAVVAVLVKMAFDYQKKSGATEAVQEVVKRAPMFGVNHADLEQVSERLANLEQQGVSRGVLLQEVDEKVTRIDRRQQDELADTRADIRGLDARLTLLEER